jgi:hypothetical protein
MSDPTAGDVMKKALDILKGQLSREEYLTYLEVITPKVGNTTKELREKTRGMDLMMVLEEAKKYETGQG